MRSGSTVPSATRSSVAARTSCVGRVPQSPWIEPVKSWPNEVEPWKFTMATTQPSAANRAAFQRQCQVSANVAWGPPWIRCTSGGGPSPATASAGGCRTNTWTSSPSAPLTVRSSSRPRSVPPSPAREKPVRTSTSSVTSATSGGAVTALCRPKTPRRVTTGADSPPSAASARRRVAPSRTSRNRPRPRSSVPSTMRPSGPTATLPSCMSTSVRTASRLPSVGSIAHRSWGAPYQSRSRPIVTRMRLSGRNRGAPAAPGVSSVRQRG